MFATTTSSVPESVHRYFLHFLYWFSAFSLIITVLVLLFLERARTEFLPS